MLQIINYPNIVPEIDLMIVPNLYQKLYQRIVPKNCTKKLYRKIVPKIIPKIVLNGSKITVFRGYLETL